ncbi:MAG: HD-GYP domain-containing protein [Lachnospiraceae bacterium]
MRIDQSIKDRLDRTLIARGTILDSYMIGSLQKLGVGGIYVSEGREDPLPEAKEPPLPPEIQKTIDKTRCEDPSKIKLSESLKQRVSTGMQYLYNNTSDDNFASTSARITNDLNKAINDNAAIAVDINALKTSDEYTFKHSVDVATMSMIIAKNMGYSQDDIYSIGVAGLLHDIGKSKVPLEILNKPAKLNDEEFKVMKNHTVFGYEIIKEKENFSQAIALAVLQHHEKMNGRGYPLGVKADKITDFAKILSVVDVYDALVTERPYKKALSQRTAIEMIMSMTEELDIKAMKVFFKTVILYPVDTIVELSNGEKAKVVKNNEGSVLRPTVVGIATGKVYNLADDLSCANILIV